MVPDLSTWSMSPPLLNNLRGDMGRPGWQVAWSTANLTGSEIKRFLKKSLLEEWIVYFVHVTKSQMIQPS